MPDNPVITISCSNLARTQGDIVSGLLDLNLALAEENGVEAVTISFRGEINTQVTVRSGNSSITYRNKVQLFDQTQTIWMPGSPLPPHASGIASFPFSFTMPTMDLPPSFHGGTTKTGGSVQYYLHAVAARKAWYKRNIRINHVFPFLPVDRTPAPSFQLPNWGGEWEVLKASKKMRRGILSQHGLVEAELHMPKMHVIPLFRPIPVRLHIVCTSKPLPQSASSEPDKFEFPRNPKLADVDLTLRQVCSVVAGNRRRQCTNDLGLQAGFGLPDQLGLRTAWGHEVQTSVADARWIVDEYDKNKGCWSEEITFSSMLVLRCPPPVNLPSLSSYVFLDLDIGLPGFGNKVTREIGPLPLTSGIIPPEERDMYAEASPQALPGEMDLPPSYYEVMHMDEKDGSNDG